MGTPLNFLPNQLQEALSELHIGEELIHLKNNHR